VSNYGVPQAYLDLNYQQSKSPIIVLVIKGVPYLFTSSDLQTALVYGASNVTYGEDGIFYGGLVPFGSFKPFIDLDQSSFTIQQRLEPEQGKGSVSTVTVGLIDSDDNYVTQICSPGIVIPDILLTECDIYLGYQNTTYPTDFIRIFHGYVSNVADGPGLVSLQISDANIKMRQNIFFIAQEPLSYDLQTTDQVITLASNSGFFWQVPQPDGTTYNKAIRTYILIDSEYIECVPIRGNNYQYTNTIQGVIYTANIGHGTDVSITIIGGGTAGSEVVTVSGSSITIKVQSGVSTAAQVVAAILQIEDASDLVIPEVLSASTTASPMAQTFLYNYTVTIQGLIYTATPSNGVNISIIYNDGGVAGSETVTVSGGTITVTLQSGISTAAQVYTAISASAPATALVSVQDVSPGLAQSAQSQTFLTVSNSYLILNVNGLVYISHQGVSAVSVAYSNTGTAGSETVSVVGFTITVNMQSGVSTNQNIYNALVAYSSIVSPLVSFQILPFCESNAQLSFGTVPLVAGYPGQQMAVINRGARGTSSSIALHTAGTTASSSIQVGDPVFTEDAMQMALKIMLSGTGKKWLEKIPASTIGLNPDPAGPVPTTQAIVFPAGVDVVDLYNLVAGDWLWIYGSATQSNNGVACQIVRFANSSTTTNNVIYVKQILTKDIVSTSITVSFRSQFDVYPIDAGVALIPTDVDIAQHIYVEETFLSANGNNLCFFMQSVQSSGKDWVQTEIYFPIGAYALTRYGQLSVGFNAPPIANQNIVTLNSGNIINPQSIKPSRALNNRNFFNQISVQYAPDDAGNITKQLDTASGPSVSLYGGYTNTLPITANGFLASYPTSVIQRMSNFLLLKYANAPVTFQVVVNWQAGSTTEAGDFALIDDSDGVLQIANFSTGKRGLGKQLFNIIDRTFDIKGGSVSLTVQNSVGSNVNDRFGTISPSSMIAAGSTNTTIIIEDSFGDIFPGDESAKWVNYVGLTILVHAPDFSSSVTVTLTGIDSTNNYLLRTTDMGFSPPAGWVVDVAQYPTSTNPNVNALYKLLHDFIAPTVAVVSGIDQFNFTVGAGDISKFLTGAPVLVHNSTWSFASNECTISAVDLGTNKVTVSTALGFTPNSSQFVDLIGFADSGFSYRLF
jgi:hypothetical protein